MSARPRAGGAGLLCLAATILACGREMASIELVVLGGDQARIDQIELRALTIDGMPDARLGTRFFPESGGGRTFAARETLLLWFGDSLADSWVSLNVRGYAKNSPVTAAIAVRTQLVAGTAVPMIVDFRGPAADAGAPGSEAGAPARDAGGVATDGAVTPADTRAAPDAVVAGDSRAIPVDAPSLPSPDAPARPDVAPPPPDGPSCPPCTPSTANGEAFCDNGMCKTRCKTGYHWCDDFTTCKSNDDVATCGDRCIPCPTSPNGTTTCDGTWCQMTCSGANVACARSPGEYSCTPSVWGFESGTTESFLMAAVSQQGPPTVVMMPRHTGSFALSLFVRNNQNNVVSRPTCPGLGNVRGKKISFWYYLDTNAQPLSATIGAGFHTPGYSNPWAMKVGMARTWINVQTPMFDDMPFHDAQRFTIEYIDPGGSGIYEGYVYIDDVRIE